MAILLACLWLLPPLPLSAFKEKFAWSRIALCRVCFQDSPCSCFDIGSHDLFLDLKTSLSQELHGCVLGHRCFVFRPDCTYSRCGRCCLFIHGEYSPALQLQRLLRHFGCHRSLRTRNLCFLVSGAKLCISSKLDCDNSLSLLRLVAISNLWLCKTS